MKFEEFQVGYYLAKGVDIEEMFYSQPAYVVISFIEHVIIDMAMVDGRSEDSLTKLRTQLKSSAKDARMENGTSAEDRMITPPNYITPTEEGYPGLEDPVG